MNLGTPSRPGKLLGCKPSPPDHRDLKLASYLDIPKLRIAMDMIPGATDWTESTTPNGGRVVPSTSALGNDIAGNCVLAAPAHQEIVLGQVTGRLVGITTDDVLAEYEKRTGYDRFTGENDNGWYIRDMLKASRLATFFNGKMEPTKAFAAVDFTNPDELAAANWLGFGTIDGFALPLTAQGQVDEKGRDLWFVPPGGFPADNGPGTWGGHCMWRLAVSPFIDKLWTWGGPAWMRRDWADRCCFESWIRITESMVMRNGRVPSGLAWDDLMADVQARAQG